MGKVAICVTVSEPVNAWYQALPKGKRSEIINNVLLKHVGRPKSKGIRRSMMSRRELDARGWE